MHGMRPFGELLAKEDALARLLHAASRVDRAEVVPLAGAVGRASAEALHAGFDVPPFDRATMDGYAVRSGPARQLRVVGDAFAGATPAPLAEGEATRIATGAPIPIGADAVVRVEDTREADGFVTVPEVRPRQNVDPAGVDVAMGAPTIRSGDVLSPARIGLLAALGIETVRVVARPRVAVVSTGDELLQPGAPPQPGRIYDSNSTALHALFSPIADARRLPALKDDANAQRSALREVASSFDLIVMTGGASVGAKDHARDALDEVLFHGVRVKPGKPLLAGRIDGTLVIGLPGNPTSALSNAALFVLPTLRQIAGFPPQAARTVRARLAARVAGDPARYLFLPVKLASGVASPTFKGSGAISSLAESDGWIGVPEGESRDAGSEVEVTLW